MLYDKRWDRPETKQPATTHPDTWRGVLLRAADIIEEKGWCRDRFANRGKRCMLGAMNEADGKRPSTAQLERLSPQRQLAEAALIDHLGFAVAAWNDSYCRTQEQVMAKLREVALEGMCNRLP